MGLAERIFTLTVECNGSRNQVNTMGSSTRIEGQQHCYFAIINLKVQSVLRIA